MGGLSAVLASWSSHSKNTTITNPDAEALCLRSFSFAGRTNRRGIIIENGSDAVWACSRTEKIPDSYRGEV
jgi:hypothetical protein